MSDKTPEEMAEKYISWDDRSVPIGKRKQLFVKWLMSKGESLKRAKLICYRKFYHEEHDPNKERLIRYLKKQAWG